MHIFYLFSLLAGLIYSNYVFAYGDYPLPICKANGATIIDIGGINTDKAFMKGIVTRADIYEDCERDSGGITTKHGGRLTLSQCIEQEYAEQKNIKYTATANCSKGTMSTDSVSQLNLKFPDPDLETLPCGAEYQYVVQFKTLCPKMAKRLKVKSYDQYVRERVK
jgi:hypothetical protein